MEELFKLIANYGFPMVVAGYLLVRLEPTIRELQKSITSLTIVVARQSGMEMDEINDIINYKKVN
ncbi:MAG TPA: YvrJ family protein [Bacillota bacterium]|nr:YvrJ family protein [Peptococcaceae bacterium MAG4]HPZ43572.1 YvrJ family protein [Bacillota bacterium]HQD75972.1 YvrJ family protein [Bacillota bacterium]HUM58301.1 YvrJ family protein [Bacillota bacterium]